MNHGRTQSWNAKKSRRAVTAGLAMLIGGGLWGLFVGHNASPVSADEKPKTGPGKPGQSKVGQPKTGQDLAALEAKNGDWSRWRGPNGDGLSQETNLLPAWPSEGPPLAYKSKGLGKGYASVSVSKGKIYTLGEMKGESHLICLDAADGKTVWTVPFGKGSPNCTPTVDGEFIYALSRSGVLGCVDSKGKGKWTADFVKEFHGKEPKWGYSESPLIDGDRLICTPGSNDHFLMALNKKTGKPIWSTKGDALEKNRGHGGAGYSSIVISHAAGVKQYVTLTGKGVIGVDASNGKLLWQYDHVANDTASIPTPLIRDDLVFCSSGYGDGGSALLKITKDGANFQAEEVYYFPAKTLQNHHGGMILFGDEVYLGHGHNNGFPVCVNLADGKDKWRPGRGPGKESAAIAYADGHLYFRYQDGTMALIEANPNEYKVTGEFKLPINNDNSWPHPVIAGGKLYLRDQEDLMVFDLRKK